MIDERDHAKRRIELRAGPLSMLFEPETAFLRRVRLGETEVLRGVYAAVRDHNWGTVPLSVSGLDVDAGEDRFLISYDATCREGEIDFVWRGEISGDPDGALVYSMDGVAYSTFRRNRIGFCVLHPIRECAGRPCTVLKTDGSTERGVFPRYIAPRQPFRKMRAISHEAVPGLTAEVRLEGDTFEMEDQRNWTDASYKTYCTPLDLPFPVEVEEGTTVSQSVALTLKGRVPEVRAREDEEIAFEVHEGPATELPDTGFAFAGPSGEREIELLKALSPSHLRVDLDLSAPDHAQELARAAAEAGATGTKLEVALFLSGDAGEELRDLANELSTVNVGVARWLVFASGGGPAAGEQVSLARRYLADHDPGAWFGTGTDAYFTQLNRERPAAEGLDFVCYSVNPQVHAFDDASLVETLEGQAATVESARRLFDLPVAVSPVTLKPRFNPDATGPEPDTPPGELPPQVDPRQASLLCAGWTLGSLKRLSEGGAHSVTYYETTGWRGLMEDENGSPLPDKFPAVPGGIFPVYHALAALGGLTGARVMTSSSGDPLSVEGLVLRRGGGVRVLLANLSPEVRRVSLRRPGLEGEARLHTLEDGGSDAVAGSSEGPWRDLGGVQASRGSLEVRLPAFALARVDLPGGAGGGG